MTYSPENFESLWAYCSDNERVIPRDWQKIYEMLVDKNKNHQEDGNHRFP